MHETSDRDMPRGNDAVALINADGASRLLLVCEHADNTIPARYRGLGLSAEARQSHIAWDPGALGLARALSAELDAPLVAGRVSRLVYDCNRPPEAPDAMPEKSEAWLIPGNAGLAPEERAARVAGVYDPFRSALKAAIARATCPPVLVTVHSFTPLFHGQVRRVELGILHDADARLADAMLARSGAHTEMIVRRNEPYGPKDGVTHTLKAHGLSNGLLNVMLEVRNDLIATAQQQRNVAGVLAGLLGDALSALGEDTGTRDAECHGS